MATGTEKAETDLTLSEQFAQAVELRSQFEKNAQARLAELEQEAEELRKSLRTVAGESESKPRQRKRSNGNGSRPGRKGKRAEEFVAIVRDEPGITVTDAAKKMGIKPNYLYRLAKQVADRGQVVKDGNGYKVA